MRRKIEIKDVPGLGTVAAAITYQVQADGTEVGRALADAKYATGGPVEDEHRQLVGQVFNAYA